MTVLGLIMHHKRLVARLFPYHLRELHERKSLGDWGRVLTDFGVGDANANCLSRFGHVSKFQASNCLNYNAVKSLTTHDSYRAFTASKNTSTSTKSPLQAENSTFFCEDTDKKYR